MIRKSKGLQQCCECKAPRQSSSMQDKRKEKSHLSLELSAPRIWCTGLGTGPCYVKRSEDVLTQPKEKRVSKSERVLPFETSAPEWQPWWASGLDLVMMMSPVLLFPGYFMEPRDSITWNHQIIKSAKLKFTRADNYCSYLADLVMSVYMYNKTLVKNVLIK